MAKSVDGNFCRLHTKGTNNARIQHQHRHTFFERSFNVADTAAILRVTTKSVYALIREQKIEASIVMNRYRIRASAIDTYLKRGQHEA